MINKRNDLINDTVHQGILKIIKEENYRFNLIAYLMKSEKGR